MRDWSTLREGPRWQPVDKSSPSNADDKSSPSNEPARKPADAGGAAEDSSRGGSSHEKSSGSNGGRGQGFRTDTQISGSKAAGAERKLQRWDEKEPGAGEYIGSLEELTGGGKTNGNGRSRKAEKDEPWDQFRANYELFGYKSTYKADMSQYTTPLDPSKVPAELRRKAEKLAKEIDSSSRNKMDDCQTWDCDDEEDLFSSVPREHGYNTGPSNASHDHGAGGEWGWTGEAARAPAAAPSRALDGGAGSALLGMLRSAAPVESKGESDYRSMVAPKVHAWWKAREIDGEALPEGEASGLVCPFSRKVFGEASQLLMHWASALPKAAELAEGEKEAGTSCALATSLFRHAAGGLRWSELIETYRLADALSVDAPKEGSVWAQVLTRVGKAAAEDKGPLTERLAMDFVTEVLGIKCWRRDQKVEHRELQESIAAALAMHITDSAGGRTWQYPADE
mmetsp:Transcript_57961/g.152648  ORF Transcript_57961/g.152648 Transcript_57961/m.152648 type:complete len:453 (+) Transcript_57961:121-1479(+)